MTDPNCNIAHIRACIKQMKDRPIRIGATILIGGILLPPVIATALAWLWGRPVPDWDNFGQFAVMTMGLLTMIMIGPRLTGDLAEEIERCADPMLTPDVIAGLNCGRTKYEPAFRAWLMRNLPAIGPGLRDVLSGLDVRLLSQHLLWYDAELSSVILDALVHAGNRETEGAIIAFIRRSPAEMVDGDSFRHAVGSLQLLRQRLDSEDTAYTLLRGSQSPDGGKDLLLRQSTEPTEQSEELLRASE